MGFVIVGNFPTFAVCTSTNVEFLNANSRRRFEPDSLPDTTAGCVENMLLDQFLLPERDIIRIKVSRVKHKDHPKTTLEKRH
jgi:hypothetical protein